VIVDDERAPGLREGRDFSTPEELEAKRNEPQNERLAAPIELALAVTVLREVQWILRRCGLPGAVPWDKQPAWRVELWETFLTEWERCSALSAGLF